MCHYLRRTLGIEPYFAQVCLKMLQSYLSHLMLFLTSELATNVEITILSERDATRAWVPSRGIMD